MPQLVLLVIIMLRILDLLIFFHSPLLLVRLLVLVLLVMPLQLLLLEMLGRNAE